MTKLTTKRIAAPKSWNIKRKTDTFILRPSPGTFTFDQGIALGTLLRDYIGCAKNAKEAKYILNNNEVLVNKVKRTDIHFPVGLMDVLEIPLMDKFFRLLINKKGKLKLYEIKKEDATIIPFKILGKTIIKKGLTQLNLSSGRTLLTKNKEYKPRDTLIIELPSKKIKATFQLQEKKFIYLTGGKHVGESGIVESINDNSIIFKTNKKVSLETAKKYAFVLGKEKSAIALID